jgi:hypothetical protein
MGRAYAHYPASTSHLIHATASGFPLAGLDSFAIFIFRSVTFYVDPSSFSELDHAQRRSTMAAGLASPIVMDNGSGMIKAGFAGADLPESVFQTYVGRAKYDRYGFVCVTCGEVLCAEQWQTNVRSNGRMGADRGRNR